MLKTPTGRASAAAATLEVASEWIRSTLFARTVSWPAEKRRKNGSGRSRIRSQTAAWSSPAARPSSRSETSCCVMPSPNAATAREPTSTVSHQSSPRRRFGTTSPKIVVRDERGDEREDARGEPEAEQAPEIGAGAGAEEAQDVAERERTVGQRPVEHRRGRRDARGERAADALRRAGGRVEEPVAAAAGRQERDGASVLGERAEQRAEVLPPPPLGQRDLT